MIFDIQRFSTHDGPGVRTVVFFKGCPLSCPWCENPESQSFDAELLYDPALCIGCLDCYRAAADGEVTVSEGRPRFHRERIADPRRYRSVCPSGALTVKGEEATVEAILAEVVKDRPFYGAVGGVTLSGGEPFAQSGLLLSLARALRARSIDLAVETTLHAPWSAIAPALPFISLILADLKSADEARLREATGARLSLVLKNLALLEEARVPTAIRVPVVPGFNDSEGEIRAIIERARRHANVREIHFLPYHTLGMGKFALLGRDYAFPARSSPPAAALEGYAALAAAAGLRAIIGG